MGHYDVTNFMTNQNDGALECKVSHIKCVYYSYLRIFPIKSGIKIYSLMLVPGRFIFERRNHSDLVKWFSFSQNLSAFENGVWILQVYHISLTSLSNCLNVCGAENIPEQLSYYDYEPWISLSRILIIKYFTFTNPCDEKTGKIAVYIGKVGFTWV